MHTSIVLYTYFEAMLKNTELFSFRFIDFIQSDYIYMFPLFSLGITCICHKFLVIRLK